MPITVDPSNTSYDLGELRLDKETIICEEFEYSVEGGDDVKTVTNSKDPIRYTAGKNEYSWSASGLPAEYHDLVLEYKLNGTLFPIGVFNILEDGDYRQKATIKNAKITSVTVTQGEDGNTIDIEGSALGIKI